MQHEKAKNKGIPACVIVFFSLVISIAIHAQEAAAPTIAITRAKGSIKIDADLSDEGWQDAVRVDKWYETNPGNNTEPKVKSVGRLTYDDKYLYAAFEFSDPEPKNIRGPFAEQDALSTAYDYGGLFIDAANDGKTAMLFLATARGIQYDALQSDPTNTEDDTPDFYWDSEAKVTATGWVLEMRVPFSSLRYPATDPQTWGIMLYRNWPRDHRVQMFNVPLERGRPCLICQEGKMTGLEGLPTGGHWSIAPYVTARQLAIPESGPGTPLKTQSLESDFGFDAKWTPSADTAVDLTVNPDFSQIEADVAQIAVNERFALLYPESRPFFLEGKDLFATPIPAVYTRTITEPDWGLRATSRIGTISYTVLASNDIGGGQVVIPGSTSSSFVEQDFESIVGIARLRYDIGKSFVSALATVREIDGGGYNRVIGPDFGWRPTSVDRINGQILFSDTETPIRPDLTPEWDGRKLQSHGARIDWLHSTSTYDTFIQYRDFGDDFRADNGFVPQVGYRAAYAEGGYTYRWEERFLTRLRLFSFAERSRDRDGELISEYVNVGAGMDGGWNSFMRYRYAMENVRSGTNIFPRNRFIAYAEINPSQAVSNVSLDAYYGQAVDFANSRPGHGGGVNLSSLLRPTDHLALTINLNRRWVDVTPDTGGTEERLFTAQIYELRATYLFTARTYVRLIGQYIATTRDPTLYISTVAPKEKSFNGTGLFTYKLNWQSVLFLGYGDERALDTTATNGDEGLKHVSRQWFLKVSYAFQGK
jgi:hypothetical protein